MDGLVVEVNLSHVVHVVMKLGLDEIVGNHRVPHFSFQLDAIVAKHLKVVLQILTHFQNFLAFVGRFKDINNLQRFFTIGRNGHVKCLEFLHSKAQTYQFCIDGAR